MRRRHRFAYCGFILLSFALVVSIPIGSAIQYSLKSASPPETPGVIWERYLGGPYWDACFDLIEVSSGGYALTGFMDSPWAGQEGKICLVRLDSEGEQLWNQTYRYIADPEQSAGYSLLECNDGGFAIAGYLGVTTHIEMLLLRTDSDGNQLWNRTFGQGLFKDMVQCSDGGFALFGSTERIGVIGNDDFYLARTDSDGNLLWNFTYGGTEADLAARNGLVLCSDEGFAMLGTSYSYGSDTEVLLIRTDSSGTVLWYQTYGGPGYHGGSCLLETDSGFIIIGSSATAYGPWILHTNTEGSMTGEHLFINHASWHRFSANGDGVSIVQCRSGGYAIAGSGLDSSFRGGGWLLRIGGTGYGIWDQFYPRAERAELFTIIESSEGGFVVAGEVGLDWEGGDFDIWIMRVADQPTIPTSRWVVGALGAGFALVAGVFAFRRREKWPGL